ncbi:MAG: MASE1 domain-containing protein, partial [Limisphaerales bacterium]
LQACAGALYFVAGKLGLSLAFAHSFISPVGPAAGLALGVVLLLGYSLWPGLLAGAFLLNLSVFSTLGVGWPALVAASLCVSTGNVLGALAGAWLVETYARGRDAFRQPHTIAMFVALAAVASTALNATSGVAVCWISHLTLWGKADELWLSWWLSDMMGVVLFTPLIIVWSSERSPAPGTQQWIEAAALGGMLLLSCWITFGGWFVVGNRMTASSFLVIPIVLWTAFRFGQRGTTIVTFIICCSATIGTLRGHGPFAVANHDSSLLLLQDFIGVIAIMSLLLAADVTQRRRSDAGLRASEQRYRELFENNPQPSWVFDYDTFHFLAVNPAAVKHYGYSREEFLSLALTDLWPAEDKERMMEMVARARAGSDIQTRCRHRKKDGTLIHVEVARNGLTFDGHQAGIALVTDVTERTRAEQRAAAFSQLGRSLSAASSPQQAAQEIIETAAVLLGCDGGSIELCPGNSEPWQTLCRMETSEGRPVVQPGGGALPEEVLTRAVKEGPKLILLSPEQLATNGHQARALSQILVPVTQED